MMQRIKQWCRSCFDENKDHTENWIPTGTFENDENEDCYLVVDITDDTITLSKYKKIIPSDGKNDIYYEDDERIGFKYTLEPDTSEIINLDDGSDMWIESTHNNEEIKIRWYSTDSHLECKFDGYTFLNISKRI